MRAEIVGAVARAEIDASCQSSATVSDTAAAMAGSVSASATTRTARDRASLEMRLAVTRMAKPHHPASARLGDAGNPTTPYTSHRIWPNSQDPAAAAHSVKRRRWRPVDAPRRASSIPPSAADDAAVQAVSQQVPE